MVEAVASFHIANPQRAGLGREELFTIVGGAADVCELAAASLVNAKKLERQGTVFARAGWSARISGGDQQLSDRISAAFQAAGWAGPTVADVATTLGEPPTRVEKMIKLLVEKAVLVRLAERQCIHRDALEAAKQVVLRLFGKRPSFSTMEFRDAVGVSRKHAVPLLDYLDKLRFTVRSGHDRTPGVEARKLLK
jgi:selenocysteine-specific elongation factor